APADPVSPSVEVVEREGYRENVRAIARRGADRVEPDVVLCYGDSSGSAMMYPYEIEAALGTKRVVNVCYPGEPASSIKARVRGDLERVKPALILITLGADGIRGEADIDPTIGDLSEIVRAAAEFGSVPIVSTIRPGGAGTEARAAYNQALIAAC